MHHCNHRGQGMLPVSHLVVNFDTRNCDTQISPAQAVRKQQRLACFYEKDIRSICLRSIDSLVDCFTLGRCASVTTPLRFGRETVEQNLYTVKCPWNLFTLMASRSMQSFQMTRQASRLPGKPAVNHTQSTLPRPLLHAFTRVECSNFLLGRPAYV